MRPASQVMTLKRLGAFHQSRLSFMRSLLRHLRREKWSFNLAKWQMNQKGEGFAVYEAKSPTHTYSLVAFAHDLPPEKRSDRVIATAWDATFCLFDGKPSFEDIERLRNNVPYQEAGRISSKELCLSRANRSLRLWQHVVNQLSSGKQPDIEQIESIGYLLRTTAVYGSGKFGAADRYLIEKRNWLANPFHIEMLAVYLIRTFSIDLVEHMAKIKGGKNAVAIEPALRRKFGVGNSTGLGMAPFLVRHPLLLHNWIFAREKAFSRVCSQAFITPFKKARFLEFVKRASLDIEKWNTNHELQKVKLEQLKDDFLKLGDYLEKSNRWQEQFGWKKTMALGAS